MIRLRLTQMQPVVARTPTFFILANHHAFWGSVWGGRVVAGGSEAPGWQLLGRFGICDEVTALNLLIESLLLPRGPGLSSLFLETFKAGWQCLP